MSMNKRSKRKLLVVMVLLGMALASVLALTAFEENLLYFYSPERA
jgi:cytochrome c-type biogenesis protein CcmE